MFCGVMNNSSDMPGQPAASELDDLGDRRRPWRPGSRLPKLVVGQARWAQFELARELLAGPAHAGAEVSQFLRRHARDIDPVGDCRKRQCLDYAMIGHIADVSTDLLKFRLQPAIVNLSVLIG